MDCRPLALPPVGTLVHHTAVALHKQPVTAACDLLQEPRPLKNDLLFGDYEVSYVSTAKAGEQKGQRRPRVHLTWSQKGHLELCTICQLANVRLVALLLCSCWRAIPHRCSQQSLPNNRLAPECDQA